MMDILHNIDNFILHYQN